MKPVSRLLIVEDHVAFRDYLKESMTARFPHIAVEEAGDGDEALAKIAVFKPRIILMDIGLMDIRLPGKNGLELKREIKANHRDIRIVILTSLGRYYRKAAYECGADDFLEKGRSSLEEIFAAFGPTLPSEL